MERLEADYIPTAEAAKILKTTHRGVTLGIINGTLPIGWAFRDEENGSTRYSTKVVKNRLERFLRGDPL